MPKNKGGIRSRTPPRQPVCDASLGLDRNNRDDRDVRFNIPCELLTDDTAHALLRIVRELVQNAIRHGRAKTVRIAGCLDGERLLFSVVDDGCGFVPDSAPGVREGHFGLQGIHERVNHFGGELEIESAPGKGTKVSISFKAGAT